jgi:hypothetical protein
VGLTFVFFREKGLIYGWDLGAKFHSAFDFYHDTGAKEFSLLAHLKFEKMFQRMA